MKRFTIWVLTIAVILVMSSICYANRQDDDYKWLIGNLGILDKAELTDTQIKEIARLAEISRSESKLVKHDNEIYLKYLLFPRVFDEPSEHYRPLFLTLKPKNVKSTASKLRWVLSLTKKVKPRDWQYLGGMAGPINVHKAQVATKSELIMYTITLLRTFGIPSRAVRAVNMSAYGVEYYDGKSWISINPQEINNSLDAIGTEAIAVINQDGKSWADATPRYIKNAVKVNLSLNMGTTRSKATAWDSWMISYPLKDDFVPLDYFMEFCMQAQPDGSVDFNIRPGVYTISWAMRNSAGQAQMQMRTLNIAAGKNNRFDFDILDGLSILERNDMIQVDKPRFSEIEVEMLNTNTPLKNILGVSLKPVVVVFVDKDLEPSRRAIDQIAALHGQTTDWHWGVVYVDEINSSEDGKLTASNGFVGKTSSKQLHKFLELASDKPVKEATDQLPITLVFNPKGELIGSWKGYATDLALKVRYVLIKSVK